MTYLWFDWKYKLISPISLLQPSGGKGWGSDCQQATHLLVYFIFFCESFFSVFQFRLWIKVCVFLFPADWFVNGWVLYVGRVETPFGGVRSVLVCSIVFRIFLYSAGHPLNYLAKGQFKPLASPQKVHTLIVLQPKWCADLKIFSLCWQENVVCRVLLGIPQGLRKTLSRYMIVISRFVAFPAAIAAFVTPPQPPRNLLIFLAFLFFSLSQSSGQQKLFPFSSFRFFFSPQLHNVTIVMNLYSWCHTNNTDISFEWCGLSSSTALLSLPFFHLPAPLPFSFFRHWHSHESHVFHHGPDWECGSHKVLPLQGLPDHTHLQRSSRVDSLPRAHQRR